MPDDESAWCGHEVLAVPPSGRASCWPRHYTFRGKPRQARSWLVTVLTRLDAARLAPHCPEQGIRWSCAFRRTRKRMIGDLHLDRQGEAPRKSCGFCRSNLTRASPWTECSAVLNYPYRQALPFFSVMQKTLLQQIRRLLQSLPQARMANRKNSIALPSACIHVAIHSPS